MITLYGFGPRFGLPDPSPFVTKAEVLLKMAELPYQVNTEGFRQAPKGKLPYIRDGDTVVADSSFIRFHLEQRYGVDFDRGLSAAERGYAWALEKLCEDHLYWLLVSERWLDRDNFERGPAKFFERVPAPFRPLVKLAIRKKVRRRLDGQGTARFTEEEQVSLIDRDLASLAATLGGKPYLMGEAPCGADATVFACISGILCPQFAGKSRSLALSLPSLVDYRDRLCRQYFPDYAKSAPG